MHNEDTAKLARARWGTDEQYFKELERFLKEHRGSSFVEYDNETGMPVQAVYLFNPYIVFIEHKQLISAIAKTNNEELEK